tara:strand:+ start:629 stop:1267 length:639 start_codon:yes stop_codon:yes gene_type:complete
MNDVGSKMIKVYKKQFKEHGYSPASLGCPKGRQDLRFKSLSKYLKKGTLLDFGCGFGDLASFLKKEDLDITYNGCDVVEDFIEVARKKNPEGFFFNTEVDSKINEDYDYIISSGVFNFLYTKNSKDHEAFVFNTLDNLFSKTKKVLSVDFLSPEVNYKIEDSYHQEFIELINFIISKLSRRFEINHTYLPYEYCVHIFKNDKIIAPENVFEN